VIAQIYHDVRRLQFQIRLDGCERSKISVNISQNGDPHYLNRGYDANT
jgi:hypothetical protein